MNSAGAGMHGLEAFEFDGVNDIQHRQAWRSEDSLF